MTPGQSQSRDALTEQLSKRIVDLTKAHWERTRTAYYLSKLGIDLGQDWAIAQRDLGLKLQQFVVTTLMGQLRVIKAPNSGHLGLFPRDAELTNDLRQYFVSLSKNQTSSGPRVPRYHPSFWSLFRVPMAEGSRRFVTALEPPRLLFRDVLATEPVDPNWIEVTKEFILPLDDTRPEAVTRLIEQWDVAHPDLHSSKFTVTRPHAIPRSERTAIAECRVDSSALLLGQVLNSLSPEQLKRTALTLDVVAALMRTR